MTEIILTNITASITEFKNNPMQVMQSAEGSPVAILNRNKPAFYCVPSNVYEHMMEMIEDMELAQIVREREGDKEIEVDINDL